MKKLLLLLLFIPFIISSCENNSVVIFKKKVTYKVSGTATEILVTYSNDKGDTKMAGLSTGTIPWTVEYSVRPETYLYLQAKNTGSDGDVKVEILLRDDILFSDYNDMPFGTATTSGFVK